MKSKGMDLFEKFWIDHTGCGADDFCFYEGCYTCEYMQDAWVAWQSQLAKIDELQARIDRYDKLIYEFISDLEKTDSENDGNIHDYWRGFGSCANSAKKILQERIIDLKGNKDEN